MFKKALCLALITLLIFGVVGCGDNNREDDVVTLTWLVPGDAQSDVAAVMEKVNEITVPKIGAKVDLQFIDTSAYDKRMKMNMASGSSFDLCFSGWVNNYASAVRNGGLMDITDIVKSETPTLYESLPDYLWNFAYQNGKIYGVPNLQIYAMPMSLVFFKDIADKYDFDFNSINKIEDVEPYLQMVKDGENGKIIPFRLEETYKLWTAEKYEIIVSNIAINIETHEIVNIVETPEYERARVKLQDWMKKGYIRSDQLSVGNDFSDYKAGRYAVSPEGWKPGLEAEMKANFGKDVFFRDVVPTYMSMAQGTNAITAVGANSQNPEKAVKLIELLNTDKKLYNLICFGIEGKHYNLDNEGKVVAVKDSGYEPQADWKFGNQFNALLREGQEDDIWEKTRAINDSAVKSPMIGFALDDSNIKTELSQISAISSEYNILVMTDVQRNEYLKKLENAGIDKVIKELQTQFDTFSKNKN